MAKININIGIIKKYLSGTLIIGTAAVLISGCSGGEAVNNEIKIPIYETGQNQADSVTASYMDLSLTEAIPASVGYLYADEVRAPAGGNILEWNVELNRKYAEGETIAVIDASSLTYDRNSQELILASALEKYSATGSEADRLRYEIESLRLDGINAVIDSYTVKAPFDCILVGNERYSVGDDVAEGTPLFYIAAPDDIYIFCTQNAGNFRLGMDVAVRLANTDYEGKTISCPSVFPPNAHPSLRGTSMIKMNEGELDRMLADTPNMVTAGWATVYVKTAEKYNVLSVADGAVKEYNSSIYCNLIQNGEKVQVPVEAGESINGYTVILSGLSEGDEIALN